MPPIGSRLKCFPSTVGRTPEAAARESARMTSMDAASIRSQLSHPVIDADGHQIEFIPLVRDLLAADAGEAVARRFDSAVSHAAMKQLTDPDQRRANGMSRSG